MNKKFFVMKIIGVLLLGIAAYVNAEIQAVVCSVDTLDVVFNQFIYAKKNGDLIRNLKVTKEITADNNLMVRYNVTTRNDELLTEGVTPLCGADPRTEEGSFAIIMSQTLHFDESDCPFAVQEHAQSPDEFFSKFALYIVSDVDFHVPKFAYMTLHVGNSTHFIYVELKLVGKK